MSKAELTKQQIRNLTMKKIAILFEKPISELEISPSFFSQIPQVAETDLLRSLQTLPGIVPVSDFKLEAF